MSSPKIVMVGGGSNAWTPNIVKDMMLTPELANSHFVLYDIDRAAAELVKGYLDKLDDQHLHGGATIVATDVPEEAFEGADYVIITISTGRLESMAHDLAIPESFGIYHTVGDTSGPGGWARAIRNYDAFVELADYINRYCPTAMVLNYTNPMTVLTGLLRDLCQGPVVGLCHGLFENLRFIRDLYKLESEDEISARYAGVNHFFWITECRAAGRDVLADLSERLAVHSLTDLLRDLSPDPMGFSSNRELATMLFRHTGIMPYIGDRHTCEFFPTYLTSNENLAAYKLVRTTIEERYEAFNTRQRRLQEMVNGTESIEAPSRSRETAADIVAAHLTGQTFVDVGNLRNIGQVANLPFGSVVETPVLVDGTGFSPICQGNLPEPAVAYVEPYTFVFDMTLTACHEGDRRKAIQALRLDPVTSHLTTEQVTDLANQLLVAHAPYITVF